MRIGVVTTSYPREAGDFAGSFVGEHVRALRALGHDVEVLAADGALDGDDGDDVTRIPGGALFASGGAPDRLEHSPVISTLEALAFSSRLALEVGRRARDWDAVIAHWLAPCALASLVARKPLLAIAHGGDVHTLHRYGLLAAAIGLLRSRGAQLAFVSDELRRIARVDAASAIVQPMGIELARFAAIPHTPTTPPTILVAGRLVAIKGIDIAIRALALIKRPVQLVVAGDGPDRAALELLDPRVTFVGAVDTARRDQLLGRASVVVVPSRTLANGRTEGTPLIALEALAANVPVVASAVGGLRELSAVRTVPPEDPRALAYAITAALDDEPRDLRATVAHLDWAIVAPRLVPKM